MGGQWAKDFPELTAEMAQDKHELGNHSYSHPHPTFISQSENIREIESTEQAVYKVAGVTTRLYAPPYGEFNNTVLEAAGQLGYKTILWSIDTLMTKNTLPFIGYRKFELPFIGKYKKTSNKEKTQVIQPEFFYCITKTAR